MPLNSWFTPLSYRDWTMEMASFMVYLTSYWTSCRESRMWQLALWYRASRYDHITSIVDTLHWLPVRYRIEYKVLLMTFKALHLLAPSYIADLLQFYQPCKTLRSSSDSLLTVRSAHLRLYGDRAFCITAPRLWNSLPHEIRAYYS